MRQQEGRSSNIDKSHTCRWAIHEQENNYNCRGSPKEVRGLSPTSGSPAQGSCTGKTSPQSIWL